LGPAKPIVRPPIGPASVCVSAPLVFSQLNTRQSYEFSPAHNRVPLDRTDPSSHRRRKRNLDFNGKSSVATPGLGCGWLLDHDDDRWTGP